MTRAQLTYLILLLLAGGVRTAAGQGSVVVNEVMASNRTTIPDMVDFGDFEDWIELYNPGASDVDLAGFSLSDDPDGAGRWTFPPGTSIPTAGHLLVWADGRNDHPGSKHVRPWWPSGQEFTTTWHHTDFRLNQDGEGVYLFDPSGGLVDSVTFGPQTTDVSYGRQPDGAAAWVSFGEPTPGSANGTPALVDPDPSALVVASPAGGFHPSGVSVRLAPVSGSAPVRYTLDGSIPTSASTLYTGPIPVTKSTVVRARTMVPGRMPGPVATQTYLVEVPGPLPTIAVSTPPAWLWDRDLGIYLNSYRDREVPANVEYLPDGVPVLSMPVGARIGGENIYRFAQKPINLYFRSEYGEPSLDWPVFDDLPWFDYRRLYLRNGGDTWPTTLMTDGLVRELVKDHVGNATQAFRPAVMVLNGDYWGMVNLREKIDERWFELHHEVAPEDLDHLESNGAVISGDSTAFMELVSYALENDLSQATPYGVVERQVDLTDFIDFVVVQAYGANSSWGHNREVWRNRAAGGKWRWVIVDTDRAFDLGRLTESMLDEMADEFDLFRRLSANAEFRERFARRFALHMNTTFRPERVIGVIDSLETLMEPGIARHADRWRTYIDSLTISIWGRTPGIQSVEAWAADVDELRTFARERPAIAWSQVAALYELTGTARMSVRSDPVAGARVLVEGEPVAEGDWFQGVPVTLEALAPPGLSFDRWIERRTGGMTTAIPSRSTWKYLDAGSAPSGWADAAFDDSAWPSGEAQLGYGDGDEATVLSYGLNATDKRITYYFRTTFRLDDRDGLSGLEARILVDDGAIVYLNGTEVRRLRMPDGPIGSGTLATSAVSGSDEDRFVPLEIPTELLVPGENVLAVEVHQSSASSSDISFDFELSARYTIASPEDRVVSTSPSFDYLPQGDAELVAVFNPVEVSVVPATVTGAVRLSRSESPWFVQSDVTVAAGAELAVEPGTEIRLAEGTSIRVDGSLQWIGTASEPIVVRPVYDGESWGTLCLNGGGPSVLEHVLLRGAGEGPDGCPAAITAIDTRIDLRSLDIRDVHLPIRVDDTQLDMDAVHIEGVTGVGDYVEANGGTVLIRNSTFVGNDLVDMDAIDVGRLAPGSEITGNTIRGFAGFNSDGIDLGEASRDVLIEANRIHDNHDKGISIGQGSSALVRRNLIARNAQGIGIKDSLSAATVEHTTFLANAIGIAVFEKNPGVGGASAAVSNSLFARSTDAAVWADELSTIAIRYSLADTDDLPGTANLRADARLLDPGGLNAGLQATSPAVDAGDPLEPADPDGSRADIGAFPYAGVSSAGAVINEVMYHASPAFDTDDWVELHNPAGVPLEIAGWVLWDLANQPGYIFPAGAVLPARGYVVVARDRAAFGPRHPGVGGVFGDMATGFDAAGESIYVYDAAGALVDSVAYSDTVPWPLAADGDGPSLELVDPALDNGLASSWRASTGFGTPGARNSTYTGVAGTGDLPDRFALHPNYPNPFNPSTVIRYDVAATGTVTIRVFDTLGREVAILADGPADPGRHEVRWDATGLASGVYFVRMEASAVSGMDRTVIDRGALLVR